MKSIIWILTAIIVLAIASPAWSAAISFSSGYWSSTFNCNDWHRLDGVAPTCSDGPFEPGSGYPCTDTDPDSYNIITSDSNNPAGGGYKGQRIFYGRLGEDPTESGGLTIVFPTGTTEIWMRVHLRWQLNMEWDQTPPYLGTAKLLYFFVNSGENPCFDLPTYLDDIILGQGVYVTPCDNVPLGNYSCMPRGYGVGYYNFYPTGVSDGTWHSVEIHMKPSSTPSTYDGIYQVWLDGVNVQNRSDIMYTSLHTGLYYVALGGNGNRPKASGCSYVDYDDIAIALPSYGGFKKDAQGRDMIGPIGWASTAPSAQGCVISGGTYK